MWRIKLLKIIWAQVIHRFGWRCILSPELCRDLDAKRQVVEDLTRRRTHCARRKSNKRKKKTSWTKCNASVFTDHHKNDNVCLGRHSVRGSALGPDSHLTFRKQMMQQLYRLLFLRPLRPPAQFTSLSSFTCTRSFVPSSTIPPHSHLHTRRHRRTPTSNWIQSRVSVQRESSPLSAHRLTQIQIFPLLSLIEPF